MKSRHGRLVSVTLVCEHIYVDLAERFSKHHTLCGGFSPGPSVALLMPADPAQKGSHDSKTPVVCFSEHGR